MKISDLFHLIPAEPTNVGSGKEQEAIRPVQAVPLGSRLSLQLGQFVQAKILSPPHQGLVEVLVAGERAMAQAPTQVSQGQTLWFEVVQGQATQQPALAPAGQRGAVPALLKNLAGILPHMNQLGKELATLPQLQDMVVQPAATPSNNAEPQPVTNQTSGQATSKASTPPPAAASHPLEPSLKLLAGLAGLESKAPLSSQAMQLSQLFHQAKAEGALQKLLTFFINPAPSGQADTSGQATQPTTPAALLSRLAAQLPQPAATPELSPGSLARQVLGTDTSFFNRPLPPPAAAGSEPTTPPPEARQQAQHLIGQLLGLDSSLDKPVSLERLSTMLPSQPGQGETLPRLLSFLASQPLPSPERPGLSLLLPLAGLLPQDGSPPAVLAQPAPPLPVELSQLLQLAVSSLDEQPRPAMVRLLTMLAGKTNLAKVEEQTLPANRPALPEMPAALQKLVNLMEAHSVTNREPLLPGQPDQLILPLFFADQAGWGEWFWRRPAPDEQKNQQEQLQQLYFFLEMTFLGPLTIKVELLDKKLDGTICLSSQSRAQLVQGLLPSLASRLQALGYQARLSCQFKEITLMQEMKSALQAEASNGEGGLVDIQA